MKNVGGNKFPKKSQTILLGLLVAILCHNSCGKTFSRRENHLISSSCNQKMWVNDQDLSEISVAAHSYKKGKTRISCPGFFAVLEDDIQYDKAFSKTAFSNNCNEEGPPNDTTNPGITQIKDKMIRNLITKVKKENIKNWVQKMSDNSMWPTRYHQSSFNNKVSEWIQKEFQQIAGDRRTVSTRLVSHQNTPQKSVEVIISGNGPNKNKFVILGGHHDSIVQDSRNNADSRSPGADDNASGVAAILETFRVMMDSNYSSDATVVFYTYAAEELGLIGSQEIARSYVNENKDVIGVMQLDMAMFGGDKSENIYLVTDYTSQTLTRLATDLIKDYLNLGVKYMKCGYACSDHASWNKYGYASFMPAEEEFSASIARIHTVRDIVDDQLSEEYSSKFSQLALAFIVSLAGYK